jgi:flagellar FliL protein
MKKLYSLLLVMCLSAAATSFNASAQNIAYFGVEPTMKISYSFASSPKRLGYLCLGLELMLGDVSYVAIAEHHEPMIKATIIRIIGRQVEEKVRSITGREEIRKKIHKELTDTFKRETGNPLIRDIIYTNYRFNC